MSDIRPNKIPIDEVILSLGVKTFHKGENEIWLMEWDTKTDWWSANTLENFVTDFTGKGRPQWPVFSFVKEFLKLDDKRTFEWFDKNFEAWKPLTVSQKKPVIQIRKELPPVSIKQQEYLASRWIHYDTISELVRDYNGSIACLVYEKGIAVGINARRIDWDDKNRFTALSWYSTSGIYYWGIDKSKDYLIVVEGLIDFLTLKQYETNVVALKSLESGYDDIIRLAQNFKIMMVFDNDWKEEKAKKKLQGIKYSFFDRSAIEQLWFECKDTNDLHQVISDEIIESIMMFQIEQTPILGTIEKYKERQAIIKEKGKIWDDWPYIIYDFTQGIVKWKVYTIGAFSNTGKSKFAYSHVPFFLKQGKKVLYLSLEESDIDMFSNIACAYYNHQLYEQGSLKVKTQDFQNLVCIDSCYTLNDIREVIQLHKPDIVFIDYIQAIYEKGSQYEKWALVALGVQRMAIENECTIFSLSQLSNTSIKDASTDLENNNISLKGAWEYYAASDVVLILLRESNKSDQIKIKIEKNKLGRRWFLFASLVDRWSNQFNEMFQITSTF